MNQKLLLVMFVALSTVHCSKTSNGSSGTSSGTTNTCTTGYLYSTYYGCQLQCGTGSVWYNNQCISTTASVTSTTTTSYTNGTSCGTNMVWYNGQCVYSSSTTGSSTGFICNGTCPSGYTQIQGQCLPQYSCGSCYAYYGGYCYIGDYAHQFYGY